MRWERQVTRWKIKKNTWKGNIKIKKQGFDVIQAVRERYQRWLSWIQYWTFAFHKRRRISWPAERLSASQEALSFIEIVIFQPDYTSLDTWEPYVAAQPVSDWLWTGGTRIVPSMSTASLSLLTRSERPWSHAAGHSLFYLQYFNFDRAFFAGLWLIHFSCFRH